MRLVGRKEDKHGRMLMQRRNKGVSECRNYEGDRLEGRIGEEYSLDKMAQWVEAKGIDRQYMRETEKKEEVQKRKSEGDTGGNEEGKRVLNEIDQNSLTKLITSEAGISKVGSWKRKINTTEKASGREKKM